MRDAAQIMIDESIDILAVVDDGGTLKGVITDWDVTRASATACAEDLPIVDVMTREIISALTTDSVLDVVRKLELYEISAVPVVKDGKVLGVVTSDLLARRSLYRLLRAQGD